ncbi:hypothetical protein [Bacillus thuringiensis]
MKIKPILIKDTLTAIRYLVIQVEDSDKEFFSPEGIPAGYNIVIKILGTRVAAVGGIEFIPDYYSFDDLSVGFDASATDDAFGLLLNVVNDISILPNEFNVRDIRTKGNQIRGKYPTIKKKLEELEEEIDVEDDTLAKALISKNGHPILVILDKDLKILWETWSTDLNSMKADYLWIPIKEFDYNDLDKLREVNNILFGVERVSLD